MQPQKVPSVKDAAWPRGPIDRFLLARLEASGLTAVPEATKRVLIRRLSFDLTGLPPTPEEADAFDADSSPDAYERLVDRLLASPRFGERWGRHWLDLVRYGETRGHEFDPAIPNAWRYRDYVIRALNADVPYNAFVTENIAGDLIEHPRRDPATGGNESVLGTGFWFLGEESHSPVDVRQDETDRFDNRLDVMSKTFLGLTIACARCHDHKFDAISQRDYYALNGFLASSAYRQVRFAAQGRDETAAHDLKRLHDTSRADLLPLAARALRPAIDRLADDLIAARAAALGGSGSGERSPVAARWAAELLKAKEEPSHSLHGFAMIALDPSCTSSDAVRAKLNGLASATRSATELVPKQGTLIVDFATVGRLEQAQNGFAFGLEPVRTGDLRVEENGGSLRIGLFDRSAASCDPIWKHLKLDEGTQRDLGRLGTWDRSGQTLRTPEFRINSGTLWYLARGAGRAYACVNSHLLINGPLHGELLNEWSEGRKAWRWVRHDLMPYQDRRVHVEFSPSDRGWPTVAFVIDSAQEPAPVEGTDPVFNRPADGSAIDSIEALAERYQAAFVRALERLESGVYNCSAESRDDAAAADWLLTRRDLFGTESSLDWQAFDAELAHLADARREIAARIAAPAAVAPAMLDGNGLDENLLIRGSSKDTGPDRSSPVPRSNRRPSAD